MITTSNIMSVRNL